jgi:hypothetical protein
MPVANGQHFLQANFVNAPNFDDAQINLLNNLSEQVIWLKLGRTKITDKSMAEVAKCKHLTHLHLEHTYYRRRVSAIKRFTIFGIFECI